MTGADAGTGQGFSGHCVGEGGHPDVVGGPEAIASQAFPAVLCGEGGLGN